MKKPKLTPLQRAQLAECMKAGCTNTLKGAPRSQQRGWIDTPLFLQAEQAKQTKLF